MASARSLPANSTIERLCADALIDAERRIEARIAGRLNPPMRARLDAYRTPTSATAALAGPALLRERWQSGIAAFMAQGPYQWHSSRAFCFVAHRVH